jgi:hypothetical protein
MDRQMTTLVKTSPIRANNSFRVFLKTGRYVVSNDSFFFLFLYRRRDVMRSSKLVLAVLVLGAGVSLISATASAAVVNMRLGETLFTDNFEAQPDNMTSHILWPDTRGGLPAAAPTGGSPGSWAVIDPNFTNVQVTDCIADGYTRAYQGTKHLRVCKYDSTGGNAHEVFARQATAGDHIRFEEMVNITDNGIGGAQILGRDSNDDVRINLYAAGGGVVQSYSGGGFNTISGLSYTANKWQKWTVDYTIGQATFDLTIDGASVSGIAGNSGGALGYFGLTQDGGRGAVFFDEVAVPEPSSVALLLTALAGLLAYAWKKRK